MDHQLGVLQRILDDMALGLSQGGVDLHPILMAFLLLFGLLAAAWVVYGIVVNGHTLPAALGLVLRLVVIAWMIEYWPWVLGGLRDVAVNLGMLATGGTLRVEQFLDPGSFVRLALESGAILWRAFLNNRSWTSFVTGFAYLLAWTGYCAAFMVMSYKVFWWQVELLLASLGGLCLVPTLAFRQTAFVGQGVVSYAANIFARFLIGAILAGALWKHLDKLIVLNPASPASMAGLDIAIQDAFVGVGVAWVFACAFLSVNRLAGMLTSGIPSLSGTGSFAMMARTLTGMGYAAAAGGAGLASAALGLARGGAAAVQGAMGGASKAQEALWYATSHHGNPAQYGQAARTLYAGVREGMSGGMQARIGQYMSQAGRITAVSTHAAVQNFMRPQRSFDVDHARGGAHS